MENKTTPKATKPGNLVRKTAARIAEAIRHPARLWCYLKWKYNSLYVKEKRVDGTLWYHYRGVDYPDYLNHGNAMSFIRERALEWCHGRGIDIGADKWPLEGAVPVYNEPEQNAFKLDRFEDGSLDFVFSSHCLEHLKPWQEALRLWITKLRPGGILFLYLPHESMKLWNPCGPWVFDLHKWKPAAGVLVPFLRNNGMEVAEVNEGRDDYWSFHLIGRRLPL